MAARLEFNPRVDAPVDELFDLMADPEKEVDWNPDAIDIRRVDDGPLGPGARWRGRYKGMGTMDIRLDEYERPARLVFSITGNRMDMRWTFTFAPEDRATQLSAKAELQSTGAMRLMSPLLGPMMRRTFAKRPAQLAAGVAARRSQRPASLG
jgi:uncharacterized protein YndB with AHSA1/START domain